jgi:electron transfer flavoprotein beta subunit
VNIVVLVKQVSDTYGERHLDPATGRQDRTGSEQVIDEIGTRALEVALRLREQEGGRITAMAMGPAGSVEVLRKALAMGADDAVHVHDDALAGSDALQTARVLAAALATVPHDLVLTGDASTDGRTGCAPAMLAELLDLPQLTSLDSLTLRGGTLRGERPTDTARTVLEAELPALASVTELAAEPRFPSFKGIMGAKKKPLATLTVADLEVEVVDAAPALSVTPRPARSGGVKVVDDGTAVEQLVDYLAAQRLL